MLLTFFGEKGLIGQKNNKKKSSKELGLRIQKRKPLNYMKNAPCVGFITNYKHLIVSKNKRWDLRDFFSLSDETFP